MTVLFDAICTLDLTHQFYKSLCCKTYKIRVEALVKTNRVLQEPHYSDKFFQFNVYNSTFKYNTSIHGGAVYLGQYENCTFENNTATSNGGAAYLIQSAVSCIFKNNTAQKGGAIAFTYAQAADALQANHSITGNTFSGNTASISGSILYYEITGTGTSTYKLTGLKPQTNTGIGAAVTSVPWASSGVVISGTGITVE